MPVKIILKQVKYLASLERMAGGGEKYNLMCGALTLNLCITYMSTNCKNTLFHESMKKP